MEKLPICRICLVQNVRMYVVVNRNLHKLYEKLTDIPFVTKDRRPILACFVCCTKLKQSYQLLRKCLDSEEQLVEMMNEDYERNLLIDEDCLDSYCGFVKSPMIHISIVDECQTESNNITVKQELPAVCEGLDEFIEPKEEHQSDELELKNVHHNYLVETNTPTKYYESDSDDEIPLMEFKTKVVEEEVCSWKQEASETKSIEWRAAGQRHNRRTFCSSSSFCIDNGSSVAVEPFIEITAVSSSGETRVPALSSTPAHVTTAALTRGTQQSRYRTWWSCFKQSSFASAAL